MRSFLVEKSLLGVFIQENGRSVRLTELKGYHVTTGEPVCQTRRPNSRIDKVRYMFNKIT